ncbi:MAG: bifunctional protein glmU [Coxiellaceae bacterium]|jgi:bifunctional UDP-N-acetylglucosamine pyrophosphorylase/glucosamine-1-phosphate N-acetyltransferase|nr:bifunctional protein glmU [Coxiellaceae bacterium]
MIDYRNNQVKHILRMVSNGLHVIDPSRIDVRGNLEFGNNVFIDINVIFIGVVILGNNVKIGPGCIINNTVIHENTYVKEYSGIEGSMIGKKCIIGPYARIRPSSNIGDISQIGNFVEIKDSIIGSNCKINHHSFIGNAIIGADAIIGAGCITCNFDGQKAVQTIIGNKAYIGAGVQLVAPINIGENSTIGAGSVITEDVVEYSKVLARSRQVTIKQRN